MLPSIDFHWLLVTAYLHIGCPGGYLRIAQLPGILSQRSEKMEWTNMQLKIAAHAREVQTNIRSGIYSHGQYSMHCARISAFTFRMAKHAAQLELTSKCERATDKGEQTSAFWSNGGTVITGTLFSRSCGITGSYVHDK